MNMGLVRRVARGLRYRPLNQLIGRTVKVRDLATIEHSIRRALGPDLPDDCRLLGPELQIREAVVAKYGILDLQFSAPPTLLEGDARTGAPLLRELGFLPKGRGEESELLCNSPWCLESLAEDLGHGQAFLLLMLVESSWPWQLWLWRLWHTIVSTHRGRGFPLQLPEGYLPSQFRIADACVANSDGVWLWKHFYL